MTIKRPVRQSLSCAIRRLSIPIVIGWIALSAYLTVGLPPLEVVGQLHSVSMNPRDAPSAVAMRRIGELFKESDSDNTAMILLEGDQPLGDNAHYYYNNLVRQLSSDTTHVQHIQNFGAIR